MTWSLQLTHGELGRDGVRLAKAIDEKKLVQDLRIHLLQQMGVDNLHPEFGSLLDGGVTPDGVAHETVIGMSDKDRAKMIIQGEIYRIVNEYQSKQLARAKRDKMSYGKATLTPKEVVFSINSLNIVEHLDAFQVTIKLTTASKTSQILNLTINNN